MNEYKVEITRDQPGNSNKQIMQTFNCMGLDKTWATIEKHRTQTAVRRIRVYNLLEVFEVK